jgi:PAS domain S-box-containing protein
MKTPIPKDEPQRLEALLRYNVLDTLPEAAFDDLARLASHICGAPIAMVSLVDDKRQWFKSKIGIDANETSRDIAFCAHTILNVNSVLEVRDASADPRFAASPLVTSDLNIRFYAGAPLVSHDGHAVGALCVMDRQPRGLTADQIDALRVLGRNVVAQLELRKQARNLAEEVAERQRAELQRQEQLKLLNASQKEASRLLALSEKSRRALLSVLEDEKRTTEDLRTSEELFRQLAENIKEVFWVVEPDKKRMLYVSPAYEAIWGRTVQSLYESPSTWLDSIHPDDRERVLNAAVTKQEAGTYDEEYRIVQPNGAICWIHDCAYPVRNAAGQIYRVVGVAEDITERKRTQEELMAKTAFLAAQVESSLDAILVVNKEGKIILQNKRLWEIFKVPAEIAGNDDDSKLRAWATGRIKDPARFDERVRELYSNPEMIGRDEIPLIDGTVLDRYSAPVRDKDGKYYGRIWAFRDITDRRKLEAQYLQAQKMESIGQLAAGVAHDFNNILGVIQMQAGLLKGSGTLSSQQVDFTDEISATVQRAAALTRQLLLFSRREVFQPRDLDLSESVTSTAKMLRRVLRENIQMELKLASQSVTLHGDPGMIDQVLMNLTVNARDAMPDGGRIIIETSGAEFDDADSSRSSYCRAGSFVCLSVTDTGTGIPPEILSKIFEPFFTTKEAGKGTGLGLATVFGIAQQHQGWVDVQSEVGRGTTFKVYFPRLLGKKAEKSAQPALKDMRGGAETILLAEDDPSLRVAIRTALSQLGYRILEAPTGAKAMEVWKENRNEIRLLLTDLIMPGGMTGKDLVHAILQENPKLNVVYMSGYSAEISGKGLVLNEGVNFLAKPFRPAKLAEVVRNNLDKTNQEAGAADGMRV